MDSDRSFQDLLERVRLGDEDACTELVRAYETEVRRFIRYRINSPKMRRFLDSVDVCQSVFAKFFVRAGAGDFDLENPMQLQRLLLKMAHNKLLDHYRKGATGRHGGTAISLTGETVGSIADAATNPTRDVESRELVDLVRGRLSVDEKVVLDQWMQGEDWVGIAANVGVTAEAVRKRFTRALDRAAKELGWEEQS